VRLTFSRQDLCKQFAVGCAKRDTARARIAYSGIVMKKLIAAARVLILAAAACTYPAAADDTIETTWNQLCSTAGRHEMSLTTLKGDRIDGVCVSITVNELTVRRQGTVVRIARAELARIRLYRAGTGHNLADLGKLVGGGISASARAALSPAGPGALASIPVIAAYGAAAVPFCILGDIVAKIQGTREVRIR
jgi:hypothetical protein